jgi:hypothetical protein
MRTVVVHYHIFKNAGSTIDHILEKTFGERWGSYDTENPAGRITPDELARYVLAHPELQAISSHQAIPHLPVVDAVTVLPILFLRHPLDRARSVYEFERRQGGERGPISRGADHASRLSFADYLRWRLDGGVNGVVHNFQTAWLCRKRNLFRNSVTEDDFASVQEFLKSLPIFGVVERFDDSLSAVVDHLETQGVELDSNYRVVNATRGRDSSLETRLEEMRKALGETTWDELIRRNEWDLRLHEYAMAHFDRERSVTKDRLAGEKEPQARSELKTRRASSKAQNRG